MKTILFCALSAASFLCDALVIVVCGFLLYAIVATYVKGEFIVKDSCVCECNYGEYLEP